MQNVGFHSVGTLDLDFDRDAECPSSEYISKCRVTDVDGGIKVHGCFIVQFLFSPTFIHEIYIVKIMLY